MSYEIEPVYPEPEDDPEGHADYLRRKVIAMARRYFVEHGEAELKDERSHAYVPLRKNGAYVTQEDLSMAILELDECKKEFNLKDID